jgi:hypothetical protein
MEIFPTRVTACRKVVSIYTDLPNLGHYIVLQNAVLVVTIRKSGNDF